MTEKQKFCPKCGTPHNPGATFCRKCGEKFSVKAGSSITDTIQQTGDTLDKAGSTLSKVESTIKTAESLAQAPQTLSPLIIRPPVEWSVFVGDIDSEAGKKAIESMLSETQGKFEERIQQEVSTRVGDVIEKTKERIPVSGQQGPPSTSHVVCPSCGRPVIPGNNFCGSCGASISIPTKPEPGTPGSQKCQKCGSPVTPEKKFCGSCGAPLSESSPKTPVCPKCGNPVTPGKKFCGSCGGKVES